MEKKRNKMTIWEREMLFSKIGDAIDGAGYFYFAGSFRPHDEQSEQTWLDADHIAEMTQYPPGLVHAWCRWAEAAEQQQLKRKKLNQFKNSIGTRIDRSNLEI